MTPNEFKAWFEGYTEAIDRTPTRKQWLRICERVSEISQAATVEYIYSNGLLSRTWWPDWYAVHANPALCRDNLVSTDATFSYNPLSQGMAAFGDHVALGPAADFSFARTLGSEESQRDGDGMS